VLERIWRGLSFASFMRRNGKLRSLEPGFLFIALLAVIAAEHGAGSSFCNDSRSRATALNCDVKSKP
jgi:hypothetical protein